MTISQSFLELLRCPLDPTARLEPLASADGQTVALVCQRCRLEYQVREGIPCMLPEEAKFPAGCDSLAALPCQPQRSPVSKEAP